MIFFSWRKYSSISFYKGLGEGKEGILTYSREGESLNCALMASFIRASIPSIDKRKQAGWGEKGRLTAFSFSACASKPSNCGLAGHPFSSPFRSLESLPEANRVPAKADDEITQSGARLAPVNPVSLCQSMVPSGNRRRSSSLMDISAISSFSPY